MVQVKKRTSNDPAVNLAMASSETTFCAEAKLFLD